MPRLLRALLALAAGLVLAGCTDRHLGFLHPHGAVADAQLTHLLEVVGLVMIVIVPPLILLPLVAWRYRRRKNRSASYQPNWGFSWTLDILAWGVPILIVGVMAVLLVRNTHRLDPYRAIMPGVAPERVQVIAYDWKWLFIYPDEGIASVNELAFPADRPLALELTSRTVMQSFQIPALGGQIYAMGGMVTQLHLTADQPGLYPGQNTNFNGRGFHQQKFVANALSPEDFKAWVARARSSPLQLDRSTAELLAERSTMAEFHVGLARMTGGGALSATATAPATLLQPGSVAAVTRAPPVYFSRVPEHFFESLVSRSMQGRTPEPAPLPAPGTQTTEAHP